MAETTTQTERKALARKEVVGVVTSTRMAKTIVVEAKRQYAHHLYRRVISRSKKFYAHDEKNIARVGDVVRLAETRPLSKLKRWRLKEVVQKAALVAGEDRKPGAQAEAV